MRYKFSAPYNGAREGNRTLIASLEGWSFTTKLLSHNKKEFLLKK